MKQKKLLLKLFETLTDDLNALQQLDPAREFAVERLRSRMRKRADIGNHQLLKAHAVSSFLKLNAEVGLMDVWLPSEVEAEAKEFIERVLWNASSKFDEESIQDPLNWEMMADLWRFGPGTSNGIDGTHTVMKIQQPMTATPKCIPMVKRLRALHPYLATFDAYKVSRDDQYSGVTPTYGNRLSTVRKNEEIERTIAIEPSGNMCLQLAFGRVVEIALMLIGLDIRHQQPRNQRLARRGSIEDDIATLDLKSASDRNTVRLISKLWPVECVRFMVASRSPFMKVGKDEYIELNMLSTMGNGFTFPVMTLTILALLYAVRRCYFGGGRRIDWTTTAVFGDDIIVPSEEAEILIEVLESAGFAVNRDKSFLQGPFRESCGGDYWNGVDVTPFYVKELRDDMDIYTAINQILSWCGKMNLFLPRSLTYLMSLLPSIRFVPEWFQDTSGIRRASVSSSFTYLAEQRKESVLPDTNFFATTLVCGGYLTPTVRKKRKQTAYTLTYVTREAKAKIVVRKGRLPKGFLSGWDPLSRTQVESNYIDRLVTILTVDVAGA